MGAIVYPVHFLQRLTDRWAAQIDRLTDPRRSKPSGTDSCECGHEVVAPRSSTYTATAIVNEWHCGACGRSWETYADSTKSGGQQS